MDSKCCKCVLKNSCHEKADLRGGCSSFTVFKDYEEDVVVRHSRISCGRFRRKVKRQLQQSGGEGRERYYEEQ